MSTKQTKNPAKNKNLIRIFIQESKRKRKKLMDALLRCSTAEDQSPAETLRAAINSVTDTISALKAGTKTLDDLQRYHISLALPLSEAESNVLITVELRQKKGTHPIPLYHYLEVKPPIGEANCTPVFKVRDENFEYKYTFDMGERNPQQIEELRSSDFEFRVYHQSDYMGKIKKNIMCMATAPLSPLAYSLNSSAPLIFMSLDGEKSNIVFTVRFSVTAPLVSSDDLLIDEIINVVHS